MTNTITNLLDFTYLMQPPKRWTFEQPKLKEWVEKWCKGKVLNLFAGQTRLCVDEFRVDASSEFQPDMQIDAYDFVLHKKNRIENGNDEQFDTIVLDPPYNLRKSREKYQGIYIGSFTKIKNQLPYLLKPNGRIITLGYDSVGMSRSRGFEKVAICLVCHSGDHNDTICVVEEFRG